MVIDICLEAFTHVELEEPRKSAFSYAAYPLHLMYC